MAQATLFARSYRGLLILSSIKRYFLAHHRLQLNYKKLGEGQPLLILHGLFGSLDNWMSLGKKWSEDFTVFLVDLRNHGKSPHTEEHSYQLMSQDVAEFCEEQDIDKCIVMGHSMGGKVTMQLCIDFPNLVEKAIIVDMGPGANLPGHDTIFKALTTFPLNQNMRRNETTQWLSEAIANLAIAQFLGKNLKRNEEGWAWKFNLETLKKDYPKILSSIDNEDKIDTPTLFIKGEESNYLRSEQQEAIAELFADYTLVEIEDAGHWVHAENPREFYHQVMSFLKSA